MALHLVTYRLIKQPYMNNDITTGTKVQLVDAKDAAEAEEIVMAAFEVDDPYGTTVTVDVMEVSEILTFDAVKDKVRARRARMANEA